MSETSSAAFNSTEHVSERPDTGSEESSVGTLQPSGGEQASTEQEIQDHEVAAVSEEASEALDTADGEIEDEVEALKAAALSDEAMYVEALRLAAAESDDEDVGKVSEAQADGDVGEAVAPATEAAAPEEAAPEVAGSAPEAAAPEAAAPAPAAAAPAEEAAHDDSDDEVSLETLKGAPASGETSKVLESAEVIEAPAPAKEAKECGSASAPCSVNTCTKCKAHPVNTKKGVKKGLCCNMCPEHGVWCTSRMGVPSQSAKPEKLVTVKAEKPPVKAKRAKTEAEISLPHVKLAETDSIEADSVPEKQEHDEEPALESKQPSKRGRKPRVAKEEAAVEKAAQKGKRQKKLMDHGVAKGPEAPDVAAVVEATSEASDAPAQLPTEPPAAEQASSSDAPREFQTESETTTENVILSEATHETEKVSGEPADGAAACTISDPSLELQADEEKRGDVIAEPQQEDPALQLQAEGEESCNMVAEPQEESATEEPAKEAPAAEHLQDLSGELEKVLGEAKGEIEEASSSCNMNEPCDLKLNVQEESETSSSNVKLVQPDSEFEKAAFAMTPMSSSSKHLEFEPEIERVDFAMTPMQSVDFAKTPKAEEVMVETGPHNKRKLGLGQLPMKIRRCVARQPVDDETPRPGATPGQTEPSAEQASTGNTSCQSTFGRALMNSCSPANLRPLVERVRMLGSKLRFGSALDGGLKEAAAAPATADGEVASASDAGHESAPSQPMRPVALQFDEDIQDCANTSAVVEKEAACHLSAKELAAAVAKEAASHLTAMTKPGKWSIDQGVAEIRQREAKAGKENQQDEQVQQNANGADDQVAEPVRNKKRAADTKPHVAKPRRRKARPVASDDDSPTKEDNTKEIASFPAPAAKPISETHPLQRSPLEPLRGRLQPVAKAKAKQVEAMQEDVQDAADSSSSINSNMVSLGNTPSSPQEKKRRYSTPEDLLFSFVA